MDRKYFITSDTFFGSKKIFEKYYYNYNNIEHMNKSIIKTWNDVVGDNDYVYHLGNFAKDIFEVTDILDYLNGNIIFLSSIVPDMEKFTYPFDNTTVLSSQIHEITKKRVIISYYPLENWYNSDELIHLYGDYNTDTDLSKISNRMNISYLKRGKPLDIDTCVDLIETYNKQNIN